MPLNFNIKETIKNYTKLKKKIESINFINNKNYIDLYKEFNQTKKIIDLYISYKKFIKEKKSLEILLKNNDEVEMFNLIDNEIDCLNSKIENIENLLNSIFSNDDNLINSIYIEIRSAVGGNESALFVEDLLKMYIKFSEKMKFNCKIINIINNNSGGIKECILKIDNKKAYENLKFESGIHRVQRVPLTESQGRLHTSTVSVAIIPERKNISNIILNENDIRIDTFKASGAGGQHVNKTNSAIRITHIKTKISVECQENRSQNKNREVALKLLKLKLYNKFTLEEKLKEDKNRKDQIGTAERAEKIRTYNFPQDRITDHRITKSFHNIDDILNGNLLSIINILKNSNL